MSRKFNATTDRITYPSDTALNITGDISLTCWVKANTASQDHQLITKKAAASFSNTPYILHTASEASPFRLQFFRRGSASAGSNVLSTGRLTTSVWKHVGISCKGSNPNQGQTIFYFNGVPEAAVTGSWGTVTTNTDTLQIGARIDNILTQVSLAHICIHNVLLTAGEFTQAFARGYASRGLIFYAPFYGSGSVEVDLSSAARVSTITNTTADAGPPVVAYTGAPNEALWYSVPSSVAVAAGLPPKSRFNIPKFKPRKNRRTVYA